LKILFVGDIFGRGGRRILSELFGAIIEKESVDFSIVNIENLAGGRGFTENLVGKLFNYGIDVMTSGNHAWDNQDGIMLLDKNPKVIRPLNYPPGNPGSGSVIAITKKGVEVAVLNVQGRVFMPGIDCPFRAAEAEVKRLSERTKIIIIDIHAEATSEKEALGFYFDGRVSAVIGTHTHVQTADERILPKGTAYITDAGMTGPRDSVIGMKHSEVLHRFIYQTPARFEPSEDDLWLNAVIVEVDESTGHASAIKRICANSKERI